MFVAWRLSFKTLNNPLNDKKKGAGGPRPWCRGARRRMGAPPCQNQRTTTPAGPPTWP